MAAAVAGLLLTARAADEVGAAFSVGITGDVNLNPGLRHSVVGPEYVWGDTLRLLQAVDAIQHESTIANLPDNDPATIQFEDPLNFTSAFKAAGVDYISLGNNHQFDFGVEGLQRTLATLERAGIPFGGVAATAEGVRKPTVVNVPGGGRVAFFAVVIDECWRWPNGSLYLDGCTCGPSANPSKNPPYQCYAAGEGGLPLGLWYRFNITTDFIAEVSTVIEEYTAANPADFVVTYLHVGPNFAWQPRPEHEWLLRNLSDAGAGLVWGTSSHHIQRFEIYGSTPIVYGLGDFLFRHIVGVEDWCPLYARPCEAYRPELSLVYVFNIQHDSASGRPRVDLTNISAFGTRHTDNRTNVVSLAEDAAWIEGAFAAQSPAARLHPTSRLGHFRVSVA